MKYNISYLFVFLLPFLFSCTENKESPKAVEGIIDLRTWDFEKDGITTLNGKWEFYWGQLLTPQDFENQNLKPEYIYVPQGWGAGKQNSKKYPDFGYATYRLNITLPKNETQYRFLFRRMYYASKVYLNGKLLTKGGKVGKNKENYAMGGLDFSEYFNNDTYPKGEKIELIIQMSNFDITGAYAGLASEINFGTKKRIRTKNAYLIIPAILVAGMLLIISLYHFILFFYRRSEYSTLIFAMLSFVFVLRLIYEKDLIANALLEQTIWYVKLMRFVTYSYILLMPIFFYLLFKKYFNKKVFYLILTIGILNFITLFFSIQKMMGIEAILYLFILLTVLFLNTVAFRAMINKEQGAIWAFLGIFIVFFANLHDILIAINVFKSAYISTYGFAIYVLFQSINIAERFSLSFKKNIFLNKRLSFQNKNLEKIVDERTQEVRQQKEEILAQNEELRQQQEEVMMINENIEKQRLELYDKNTAITDSIRYAKTIQKATLPTKNYRTKLFPNSFVLYRPKDIVSGDFFWINNQKDMSFIACVDCTGHGVPGAFMSMIGNNLLNEAINHGHCLKPSQILNYLNDNIGIRLNQSENKNSDGMDIGICRFEKLENGRTKLLYAGAKGIFYTIKNNELVVLKGNRKSIGGVHFKEGFLFQDFEMELEEGDMIYMTSDGYIDQANEERKRFGSKRFKELTQSIYQLSIEEQKLILEKELDTHQGNEKQRDDITVIGIRIT